MPANPRITAENSTKLLKLKVGKKEWMEKVISGLCPSAIHNMASRIIKAPGMIVPTMTAMVLINPDIKAPNKFTMVANQKMPIATKKI